PYQPIGDYGINRCTFRLVEALTRAGRSDRSSSNEHTYCFRNMKVNHLSEEAGVTGEPLGNMPQALAHLAFISAIVNLDRALDERAASRSWGGSHLGPRNAKAAPVGSACAVL
ncbi:MAG TPA: hypothetical protein VMI06_13265, partial [Terriglobia bacterium]|nr:hypothetical protein [Terriglobia bacterium]